MSHAFLTHEFQNWVFRFEPELFIDLKQVWMQQTNFRRLELLLNAIQSRVHAQPKVDLGHGVTRGNITAQQHRKTPQWDAEMTKAFQKGIGLLRVH